MALFVSDVHLHAGAPATAQAFLDFLARHAQAAQRLYILGDLFEYWAGDDDLQAPFNARMTAALRAIADAGVTLFWMAGNRDFLIGPGFAAAAGATLLPDPTVVELAGRRLLLSHGDAQCTDDVDYQAFRRQVRDPAWQQAFLAQPLADRLALIARMRAGSRDAQKQKSEAIMDVNPQAIAGCFDEHLVDLMVHGHTHRPAMHVERGDGATRVRHVLTDWDCEAGARRGGGLLLEADGTFTTLALD